jgi:8-oxo-dGTP diphosphatase
MSAQPTIRLRVCLASVKDGKILLVPHYFADGRPVQWFLPGGGVDFGEPLREAVVREFAEETGLQVSCDELLGTSERIEPETPWHGVTIAFHGHIVGGEMIAEISKYSQFGDKTPKWFSKEELSHVNYHPRELIDKALR